MFKEAMAIKIITGIISQWEKLRTKLEGAIDSLREVVEKNEAKMRTLEDKNKSLLNKIDEAQKFKNNVDKMLN